MITYGSKNKTATQAGGSEERGGNEMFRKEKSLIKNKAGFIALMALLLATLLLPLVTSRYIIYIATLIIINVICAQGLNLLTGYSGQVSLGHGGFMAISAYLTAILCNNYHLSFWIVLVLAPLVSGMVGVLIALPALRLKGLYLAMVTVAFHMVVALGLMSLDITGGYEGIDVPRPRMGSIVLSTEWQSYYLALLCCFLFMAFFVNLSRTKIYRALIAIKEREISAQSMGISLWGYKTLAFFLASVYAGVAGCLFAVTMGHITPNHFPLMLSIEYVMMIIVGGPGSIVGVILGSVLITVLPFFLIFLTQKLSFFFPMLVIHFANLKIMVYGAIIVFFLMYVPSGFRRVLVSCSTNFQRIRLFGRFRSQMDK
jgi:branched-chain amino acid transport system permease protein